MRNVYNLLYIVLPREVYMNFFLFKKKKKKSASFLIVAIFTQVLMFSVRGKSFLFIVALIVCQFVFPFPESERAKPSEREK